MQASREFSDIQTCYNQVHAEVELAKDLLKDFYLKASSNLSQLDKDIHEHMENIKFLDSMKYPPIKKNFASVKNRLKVIQEISNYGILVKKLSRNLEIFKSAKQANLKPQIKVSPDITPMHVNDVVTPTTPNSKLPRSSKISESEEGDAFQLLETVEIDPETVWPLANVNDDNDNNNDGDWFEIKMPEQ